jgi:hypothetical protein
MRRFKRRVQLPPAEADTTWAGTQYTEIKAPQQFLILSLANPNSSYLFFYSDFF